MAANPDLATARFDRHCWKCRLCGYERYHRVVVTRANNARYTTQFFACSRCSVMFKLPANFDAGNPEPVVDVKPVTEFRVKARGN